ncbi:hypothetical protein ACHHYP_07931 [Achlya hypogyna]|uniref:Transmembrane protein n=1 Tax=Achlya hypogyna TaxID=1202772 RepID=A0A1V9YQ48_ACHHY|nr:hypothetical protein ACHHYP_07931 [Achlya hypogyna]
MTLSTLSTALLWVNLTALAFIAVLFFCNYERHARNVRDPYSQTITVRLALVCFVSGIGYFIDFCCQLGHLDDTTSEIQEAIDDGISGALEGVVLLSFFTLVVLQAGGTDATVTRFAEAIYAGRDNAVAVAQATYNRYRRSLLAFAVLRPLFSVALALLSTEENPEKLIRVVLAIANVGLLVAAMVALVRTLVAVKETIPASFLATRKLIVVKLLLVLSTLQWTIYTYVDDDATEKSHLKVYWTVCLVEVLLLSIAYYAVSSPETFSEMATPTVRLFCLWDAMQHPIPVYKAFEPYHAMPTTPASVV